MESFVSIIYAFCGLSYTILAGCGKYSAFIFGLISAVLYSYFSFKSALWGNFTLNFLYYVPIQIVSIVKWINNTNPKTKSVYKTKMQSKEFLTFLICAFILSLILSCILYLNNDRYPVLDGIITIFSVLGAYLTMKRVIEQWAIWSVVNLLTCIVWFDIKNYAVLGLWIIYLILGIVFYFRWKKEINTYK